MPFDLRGAEQTVRRWYDRLPTTTKEQVWMFRRDRGHLAVFLAELAKDVAEPVSLEGGPLKVYRCNVRFRPGESTEEIVAGGVAAALK